MSLTERAFLGSPTAPASIEALRRQYGCGAVDLTGSPHALYDRHLFFDNVMHPAAAGLRGRYEAVARSLRDVLSQRWIHTEQSYERNNPQRALEKLANLHELTALYSTLHGAHRGRVTELERPWWRRLFRRRWVGLAAAWCAGRSCDRFLLRRLKHRRRPIQRLSMEFLIGRSLANNIVNLSLAPFFDRIPFDRPVVGYGGKTINTLRLLVGRCCR